MLTKKLLFGIDIDGLGSRKIGGQLLCAYRDTHDAESALNKQKLQKQEENPLAAQSGNCSFFFPIFFFFFFFFRAHLIHSAALKGSHFCVVALIGIVVVAIVCHFFKGLILTSIFSNFLNMPTVSSPYFCAFQGRTDTKEHPRVTKGQK